MAMTWTSLTAAKGVSGSIANFVNYTLLDINPIVDEAQTLLYGEGNLRCREMQTDWVFTMPQYSSYIALPTGFLDPIGDIRVSSFNSTIEHREENLIQSTRPYQETFGTLGANPFTTTSGSNTVSVYLENHGFTQDSTFFVTGAAAFNGVTINGTFPINAITDANDFTIDITILGTTPSGSGAGGGSAVDYTCDALTYGTPRFFGIWNERINFEQAFNQQSLCRQQYYQSLPLLSSTNQTNFLTNRYPNLMRVACEAAAADFMKDDTEYQKHLTRLQAMVERIAVQDDMKYRGMMLYTDNPV
jgi:hypothetical protein